ncbi:Retrovirus-related Pol polyprotein [Labeo rohita]|uniref:Gypsy retrotransposon integrase-like protein 1 n=1 Tax=Labeo rohita TaxID=84645 RepID=A0ABQ8L0Z9_LABRO|nr:Retrovirus-related Pol polyprotein [Labeo rohita]
MCLTSSSSMTHCRGFEEDPSNNLCSSVPPQRTRPPSSSSEVGQPGFDVAKSYTGNNVPICVIEMGCNSVALHTIHLKSDLISVTVSIAVHSQLPVVGVDMILGNDLAGTKVFPYPIISAKPDVNGQDEALSLFSSIFPSCTVTRAQKKKFYDVIDLFSSFLVSSPETTESAGEGAYQIILPTGYCTQIMKLAHDHICSGHLGVTKTHNRIAFFWSSMKSSVSAFVRSCRICQLAGPLTKAKSGHQYILTIMCTATRYPEAVPLRSITTKAVVKELVNAYNPESLKVHWNTSIRRSSLRTDCVETGKDLVDGLPLLMLAVRSTVQESLG